VLGENQFGHYTLNVQGISPDGVIIFLIKYNTRSFGSLVLINQETGEEMNQTDVIQQYISGRFTYQEMKYQRFYPIILVKGQGDLLLQDPIDYIPENVHFRIF